jgi:hypothetical protein
VGPGSDPSGQVRTGSRHGQSVDTWWCYISSAKAQTPLGALSGPATLAGEWGGTPGALGKSHAEEAWPGLWLTGLPWALGDRGTGSHSLTGRISIAAFLREYAPPRNSAQ